MEKLTKAQEMSISIYENLNRVLINDEDRGPEISKVELGEDGSNITDFFTAELLALHIQFENLTGNDGDLIDFVAILNKLAFQFLLETNKGGNNHGSLIN